MIEVTVAARSEGVDQIRSIRCCCCMRPLLRMPAITKQKARMCARRGQGGGGGRSVGQGGTRRAACSRPCQLQICAQGLLPYCQEIPSFYFCSGKKKKIDTDAPQLIVLGCRIDRSAL
ncbi:hypothetical protein PVAP13_1NG491719 [Panicum virgatum]|uniref:Uncharacterized protein n=1 Tax=Panicum virgatum TaxID=38727 RepID=A0A8T0X6I1_PANVG|nr:hypothetical protein PVAP13_1NG491719 [Panicum virgatum]